MARKISEERKLQFDLISLYVTHSEAISNAMELTTVERKALYLDGLRAFTLNRASADALRQNNMAADTTSSVYARTLRQSVEQDRGEIEAELLKTATASAVEVLAEIEGWGIPALIQHISNKHAENEAAVEAGRLHNQPEHLLQNIDFWVKASSWSAEDAVVLSTGREPSRVLQQYFRSLVEADIKKSAFLQYFANTQALLQDAMDAGVVPTKANLFEVVDWFNRMEIEFPSDLGEKVRHYHGPADRAPAPMVKQSQAANAEKQSLLQLVAAMASEQYGFHPKKNNAQVVSNIFDDLEQVGLGLSRKTVTKWLNEATSHIHPDKWDDG